MHQISVDLPDSSTGILPDARSISSGQSTGMKLYDVLQRIERRLKALGLSADKASNLAGKPDAIRNIRRAVSNGRAGVSAATIMALAPALKTTSAWLLDEEGPEEIEMDVRSEDVADGMHNPPLARMVRIKGYVGAGSVAHYYAVSDEDFEEVEAPEGASDQTIAVEIRGKSFGPLVDNWLVFYDDVRSPVTEDQIGKTCVVGLADDRIVLKEIQRNGRGGFRLLSNSSEAPMEDVAIEWAAKVIGMRQR